MNNSDWKTLTSPYDPQDIPEDELWFLPGAEAHEPTPAWQGADHVWPDAAVWQEAERANAVLLARAAQAFGALDERLREATGARNRIALMLVSEFSWHLGDRLAEDRIALYLAARITHARDQMPAFAQAGWAHRRLLDRQELTPGGLPAFLGRALVAEPDRQLPVERPQGDAFSALETQFWSGLSDLADSHPITRAGYAWQIWNRLGLSGELARLEGAIVAARIGAAPGRAGIGFLPLGADMRGDTPAARLAALYAGTETNCQRALMELDRITGWQDKATAAIAGLSGRTPARLIAALADWPMLSAEALEHLTGASRSAVQRNIDRLKDLGLIREVTGQGRFRLWQAKA